MDEKLIELYKQTFGKKPHHKSTEESIIKKLEEKGVEIPSVEQAKPQEEVKKPEKKEETKEVKAEVIEEAGELPLVKGSRFKTYLVNFRGNPVYWAKNTIILMRRTHANEIELPEGSPFTMPAINRKCKNC